MCFCGPGDTGGHAQTISSEKNKRQNNRYKDAEEDDANKTTKWDRKRGFSLKTKVLQKATVNLEGCIVLCSFMVSIGYLWIIQKSRKKTKTKHWPKVLKPKAGLKSAKELLVLKASFSKPYSTEDVERDVGETKKSLIINKRDLWQNY